MLIYSNNVWKRKSYKYKRPITVTSNAFYIGHNNLISKSFISENSVLLLMS